MTREILENCKPASPERSAGICRRREKERGREGNKTDYKCLDDETLHYYEMRITLRVTFIVTHKNSLNAQTNRISPLAR
jgi:hypothetical protein